MCHLVQRGAGGGHGCCARFDGLSGGDGRGIGPSFGGSVGDVAVGDEVDGAGDGWPGECGSNGVGAWDRTTGASFRWAPLIGDRVAVAIRSWSVW